MLCVFFFLVENIVELKTRKIFEGFRLWADLILLSLYFKFLSVSFQGIKSSTDNRVLPKSTKRDILPAVVLESSCCRKTEKDRDIEKTKAKAKGEEEYV